MCRTSNGDVALIARWQLHARMAGFIIAAAFARGRWRGSGEGNSALGTTPFSSFHSSVNIWPNWRRKKSAKSAIVGRRWNVQQSFCNTYLTETKMHIGSHEPK